MDWEVAGCREGREARRGGAVRQCWKGLESDTEEPSEALAASEFSQAQLLPARWVSGKIWLRDQMERQRHSCCPGLTPALVSGPDGLRACGLAERLPQECRWAFGMRTQVDQMAQGRCLCTGTASAAVSGTCSVAGTTTRCQRRAQTWHRCFSAGSLGWNRQLAAGRLPLEAVPALRRSATSSIPALPPSPSPPRPLSSFLPGPGPADPTVGPCLRREKYEFLGKLPARGH